MLFTALGCPECLRTAVDSEATTDEIHALVFAQPQPEVLITHESAGLLTCARGHQSVLVFQGGAYGLLYERALQRLADGAIRDAILDAYTALEMYLHTVVERVRFEAHPGSTLEAVRIDLKDATKTADRVMGAALAAIAVRSGSAPPKVPSKLQELRNKATHAGEYPAPQDAEWAVLEVARIVADFEALFAKSPKAGTVTYAEASSVLIHIAQRERHPDVVRSTIYVPLVLDASGASPSIGAADRLKEYQSGAGIGWR